MFVFQSQMLSTFLPFLFYPLYKVIICPDVCPVKDDKELDAGGLSLTVTSPL